MSKSLAKQFSTPRTGSANARLVGLTLLIVVACASGQRISAKEFQRTLAVTNAEPVALRIEISSGGVDVLYSRDGQVSIAAFAQADADSKLDDNYLNVDQAGNRITLRYRSDPGDVRGKIKVRYRIEVPYRTEVVSRVNRGKQTIRGILGPVAVSGGVGDIKVAYVSKGLQVEVETGNVDMQAIGEHVEARTGRGNISGERLAQGINARTGDGDITLMVVGSSTATVEKGNGRIEIGGARGTLACSADGGDVHVQAVPHSDWDVNSAAGAIRLDLPPVANFDLDVSTESGELEFERDDLAKPSSDLHRVAQRVGAGGKLIKVRTGGGRVAIR